MIKRATGDWRRRIPPWVEIRTCDLRRYRGPYADRKEGLFRKGRAITSIYRALGKARRDGGEVLVIRLGEATPRRDALHALVRTFVCSREHEDIVRVNESRLYADRLVLALRPTTRLARSGRHPIEPTRHMD